jgi:hypothetical protein
VQSGYGFVHFSLTPEGIESALQAVQVMNRRTVETVGYECSISHGLKKVLEHGRSSPASSPPPMNHSFRREKTPFPSTNTSSSMGHFSVGRPHFQQPSILFPSPRMEKPSQWINTNSSSIHSMTSHSSSDADNNFSPVAAAAAALHLPQGSRFFPSGKFSYGVESSSNSSCSSTLSPISNNNYSTSSSSVGGYGYLLEKPM